MSVSSINSSLAAIINLNTSKTAKTAIAEVTPIETNTTPPAGSVKTDAKLASLENTPIKNPFIDNSPSVYYAQEYDPTLDEKIKNAASNDKSTDRALPQPPEPVPVPVEEPPVDPQNSTEKLIRPPKYAPIIEEPEPEVAQQGETAKIARETKIARPPIEQLPPSQQSETAKIGYATKIAAAPVDELYSAPTTQGETVKTSGGANIKPPPIEQIPVPPLPQQSETAKLSLYSKLAVPVKEHTSHLAQAPGTLIEDYAPVDILS